MNKKINPCLCLKHPGHYKEKADIRNMNNELIYEGPGESINIQTGEINKGIWDYGYELHIKGNKIRRVPGKGDGWFEKESDAALYALQAVRIGFWSSLTNDAREAIREAITRVMSPTLF